MLRIPLLGGSAASRVMKGRPRRRVFKCYVFNSWWLGGSLVLLEAGVMSPCRRHCPGFDVRAWRASGWGTCRMPKGKLRGVGVLDLTVGVGPRPSDVARHGCTRCKCFLAVNEFRSVGGVFRYAVDAPCESGRLLGCRLAPLRLVVCMPAVDLMGRVV